MSMSREQSSAGDSDVRDSSGVRDSSDVRNSIVPMLIIGMLFFIFGFVTWLNGSLIPFLQIACELNHVEAYFVTLVFYIAYTLTALPAARVLKSVGYKRGMIAGLLIIALGVIMFIPAAQTRMYSVFLVALFVMGTGLTLLQTASNPYVVLIGPRETAAVRISIMGVLNKSAGILAPLIFTTYILTDMSQFNEVNLSQLSDTQKNVQLQALSLKLIQPYMIMAIVLLVLSFVIYLSPLPEPILEESSRENALGKPKHNIIHYPQLILGVLALFFYIGAEVVAGDTIGLYGKELGVSHFGQLTSYTMAFMVSAYLIGMVAIPRWISQEQALMGSAILGLVFSTLILTTSKESAAIWNSVFFWIGAANIPDTVLFVALLGFANALVWPTIWPMALKDLGPNTATGSALLIMGVSGGAVFPLLYGLLSEVSGNFQAAYGIMIPCYAFILYYAIKGHKLRSWK